MKKMFVLLIVAVGFIGTIGAQEGYKDFQWGQTVTEVSKSTGALTDLYVVGGRFPAPQFVAVVLYSDELDNRVPDPMFYDQREITHYAPEGTGDAFLSAPLSFWFVGNELVAVELSGFSTSMMEQLTKRYGSTEPVSGQMSSGYNFEASVWKEGDRVILWDQPEGGTPQDEKITYIDRHWFDSLIAKVIKKRKEESTESQNRLD